MVTAPSSTDMPWYDGPPPNTLAKILDLTTKYRADSVVCLPEEQLLARSEEAGLASKTAAEITFSAICALEREVNNGGYDQLFRNSTRRFVPVEVDSLAEIGATEAATLARRAISVLSLGEPVIVDAIETVMSMESDDRDDALHACDAAYYAAGFDFAEDLIVFARRNAGQILLN